MAERNFLAFDLGAESGRAMLGTLSNDHLAIRETHRFANPYGRINGHFHWNLLSQWEELKTGLRKTAAGGTRIDGIGIDTWGVDYGLLAADGSLLGNPFMYRDARTNGILERTYARVPRADLFAATGSQFMQFNTLFQLLADQESGSRLLELADKLLFMPDLFNYLFTGVKKNEFSIVSTSQMYDPRKKRWATELLKRLNIPERILGEIVSSGTVLGPIRKDVAEECGCGGITVIAPATHDTASAVASVPADSQKQDWCYISSGTWSLMGVEINEPVINEKTERYNYTNEGGVGGTVRLLKNIMGLWLVQECRRHWVKTGQEHTYAELVAMAATASPFKAMVNPDDTPFISPGEMPRKIEEFCRRTGQNAPTTQGEFVRTCLESLALTYRRTVEGLEDILGRRINIIHIVGGGSNNELLNQMTADACGRTVIAGPAEATAMGNLLVQAMAVGDVKDIHHLRAIVRNSSQPKRYEPRNSTQWNQAYARFSDLVAR